MKDKFGVETIASFRKEREGVGHPRCREGQQKAGRQGIHETSMMMV
jgi:hypothetical protein